MPTSWDDIADRAIDARGVGRDDALSVVRADDDELLPIMQAAFRVRRHFHGRRVKVHRLRNAKSGICPEDCSFCSQAARFRSPVPRYPIQTVEELVAGGREAAAGGAVTYCMVTATRGPSERDLEAVCEATRQIKADNPGLAICASLGLLSDDEALTLRAAGVDRYNHNLETSRRYFGEICTTHTFDDRVATLRAATAAGMEACCGGILGMGETVEDWVDLAFSLKELRVASVPINFLDPRPDTPLGDRTRLRPAQALRGLAMFRFVHADRDVRVAGGREACLRSLQPLALYAANSLFTNGYLTTDGQGRAEDWSMIEEAGFEAVAVAS